MAGTLATRLSITNLSAIVLGLSAFILGIGVIWKALRYIFKFDKAAPILLQIAEQFTTNGGSTMLDKINKLVEVQEQHMLLLHEHISTAAEVREEINLENKVVLKIAEDSRLVANTNAAIVNELASAQTADLQHIRDYLHTKLHQVSNSILAANLQARITEKRSLRIEQRLDELIPYVRRQREDYSNEAGNENN